LKKGTGSLQKQAMEDQENETKTQVKGETNPQLVVFEVTQ